MPRSREKLQLKRQAAAHHQQLADRALQQQVLASRAEEPTPTPAEDPTEDDGWDSPRWRASTFVGGLMRRRFGSGWTASPRLERLAQAAALDYLGQGSGASLEKLRCTDHTSNLEQCLLTKFGD